MTTIDIAVTQETDMEVCAPLCMLLVLNSKISV